MYIKNTKHHFCQTITHFLYIYQKIATFINLQRITKVK